MIDPFNVKRWWDVTQQPLKERLSVLPLGRYEDGSIGLAWPGLLAQPAESFARMADTPMPPVNDDDAWRRMSQDSFDAAGLAMTGGLGVGLAGGLADNAVGSAGGRLTPSAADLPARSIDGLGYYSGALEAAKRLRQNKGTPEQMLAMLKKEGAKDAELQSIGLAEFLQGRPSVTRDDLVQFAEANRVALNESSYAPLANQVNKSSRYAIPQVLRAVEQSGDTPGDLALTLANDGDAYRALTRRFPELSRDEDWADTVANSVFGGDSRPAGTTKWSTHSLDPNNPTYRETVLSLPERDFEIERNALMAETRGATPERLRQINDELGRINDLRNQSKSQQFQSGHFSEPNIIGHMMTSRVNYEGKPTYLIDQIQSDWGQKLRDGGVRDEAKIAELNAAIKRQTDAMELNFIKAAEKTGSEIPEFSGDMLLRQKVGPLTNRLAPDDPLRTALIEGVNDLGRMRAEMRTMESSSPGNPLVNTTDQWVNTTLRRALRQAAEAGDEYVAVPSGRTVLSYNPGDEAGMEGFYNSIVPKNLGNILKKLGVEDYRPALVPQLETPGKGMAGDGFSLFALPPEVRQSILDKGLPLFVNAPTGAIPGLAGTIFDDDDDLPVLRPLP